MNAIELIKKEREEQIVKHGRTVFSDMENNPNGELIKAALAILDHDHNNWPSAWEVPVYIHINNKSWVERLVISASLIAAEIERLQAVEETEKELENFKKWTSVVE